MKKVGIRARLSLFCELKRIFFPNNGVLPYLYLIPDFLIANAKYGADIRNYFDYRFFELSYRTKKYYPTAKRLYKVIRKSNMHPDRKKLLNKTEFNKLYHDLVNRDWLFVPDSSIDEYCEFLNKHDRLFCKPLKGEYGGGTRIINASEHKSKESFEGFCMEGLLLEELIIQHAEIAAFNPNAVNTMRIVTMITPDSDCKIAYASIRIGCGSSIIDNVHQGGMLSYIDVDTGIINTPAYNWKYEKNYTHPISGKLIVGFAIPYWDNIINTVRTAALRLKNVRYVGWDVSISDSGVVYLIEGNTNPGNAFCRVMTEELTLIETLEKLV